MRGLPTRVLVALGITVVAVLVLAGMAIVGGSDGSNGSGSAASSSDVGPERTSTSTVAPTSTASVTTTSLVIPADWYPKGSSRYSNRKPPVTVTTISAPTSSDTSQSGG